MVKSNEHKCISVICILPKIKFISAKLHMKKKNSLKCLAVGLMMTIGLNERISLKRSFCFKRGIFSVSGEVAHRRTCTQTFGYKSYPVMTSPGELVVVRYEFSKS